MYMMYIYNYFIYYVRVCMLFVRMCVRVCIMYTNHACKRACAL